MKNYLFAPFKSDDEKIESFNNLNNYLPKGHQNQLVLFIGRLESYYDVIISELKADESESMGWIEQYKLGQSSFIDKIDKLKAEIKTLKADYDNDIKASYELDDKHVEIIKTLETEKDALLVANGELLQSNLKLREDNGVLDGFKEGSNQSI